MPTPLDDAPELCRLTVASLTEGYAAKRFSPMDVVGAALDRADTINPKFHAFTFIDHDGALTAARAAETRWRNSAPLSPIDGIPVTIKDIVRVRRWTLTYGSKTAAPGLCDADAPSVSAWRDAGAVFIGQTTTPEFGWKAVTDSPRFGLTRNPWNPDLTPGGSSGGAAVAAATGAGVLHLGTDGGGSIRIPAPASNPPSAWCPPFPPAPSARSPISARWPAMSPTCKPGWPPWSAVILPIGTRRRRRIWPRRRPGRSPACASASGRKRPAAKPTLPSPAPLKPP
jgi:amidase/aspartyl-tRNA(Asn)/glutamyl-tRNA(Gln) amidotransferase subunit A